MSSHPAISCLMPLYNQAQFVGEAIKSILEQTDDDFELIVIDDGSTDDSARIVSLYNDNRITIIRNSSNTGTTAALNIGLRAAKGTYLARMDADDISLSSRFALQRSFMEANPDIAVCGSHVMTIGESNEVVRRPLGAEAIKCFLLAGPPFSHASVFMRRSVLESEGMIYDEAFRTAQDYDLWFRLLSVAKGGNIDEVLLKHRIHKAQVSSNRHAEQSRNADLVRRRVLEKIGLSVSDHDLDRHTKLFRHLLETTSDNLLWAEGWLASIAACNKVSGFFDGQALGMFLDGALDAFRSSCQHDKVAGPSRLYLRLRHLLSGRR